MAALDIQFTGVTPSAALSQLIEEKVERLEHYFDQIKSCRVVISTPHKHHKNKFFHTTIHLAVPRTILVVDHEREKNETHLDAYQSVNDAFAAMTRQLESYVQKMHGKVKQHNRVQPQEI